MAELTTTLLLIGAVSGITILLIALAKDDSSISEKWIFIPSLCWAAALIIETLT